MTPILIPAQSMLKSVISYRADKVKLTSRRTDSGNDNTLSTWKAKGLTHTHTNPLKELFSRSMNNMCETNTSQTEQHHLETQRRRVEFNFHQLISPNIPSNGFYQLPAQMAIALN